MNSFTKACDGSSGVGCHILFGLKYYYGQHAIELNDLSTEKYLNKLLKLNNTLKYTKKKKLLENRKIS